MSLDVELRHNLPRQPIHLSPPPGQLLFLGGLLLTDFLVRLFPCVASFRSRVQATFIAIDMDETELLVSLCILKHCFNKVQAYLNLLSIALTPAVHDHTHTHTHTHIFFPSHYIDLGATRLTSTLPIPFHSLGG